MESLSVEQLVTLPFVLWTLFRVEQLVRNQRRLGGSVNVLTRGHMGSPVEHAAIARHLVEVHRNE